MIPFSILISLIAVVIPKEGQMRFAGQALRSIRFVIFWAADNRNNSFFLSYRGT
jgi:hypothetical protein